MHSISLSSIYTFHLVNHLFIDYVTYAFILPIPSCTCCPLHTTSLIYPFHQSFIHPYIQSFIHPPLTIFHPYCVLLVSLLCTTKKLKYFKYKQGTGQIAHRAQDEQHNLTQNEFLSLLHLLKKYNYHLNVFLYIFCEGPKRMKLLCGVVLPSGTGEYTYGLLVRCLRQVQA